MTAEQLGILQHALGVDQYGRGPHYRNHFCAGGRDADVCRELVAMGFMRQHATTDLFPYYNYSVTEEGKQAMLAESPKPPKLTVGQKRYREWLKVADCFPDWEFGDWLKARGFDPDVKQRWADEARAAWDATYGVYWGHV